MVPEQEPERRRRTMAAPAILQIDDGTLCDAAAEPSVRRRRRPSPVSLLRIQQQSV
jgi:hypothetical protein